jgi:hypothetical protein
MHDIHFILVTHSSLFRRMWFRVLLADTGYTGVLRQDGEQR